MIFGPRLLPLVLDGRKTMTRRVIYDDHAPRYLVGRSYAVQAGRGKPALAYLVVTDRREERLREITEEDARREGFPSRAAFFDYWGELYGGRWYIEQNPRVAVITFAVARVAEAQA